MLPRRADGSLGEGGLPVVRVKSLRIINTSEDIGELGARVLELVINSCHK